MKKLLKWILISVIFTCVLDALVMKPIEASVQGRINGGESVDFKLPDLWEYSAPLIAPEKREVDPSRAQKDPTVVFYKGKWHVFMTR